MQEIVREKINDGEYKKGDLIPTEQDLQDKYSVSRSTVRKAIEGLVFEGLLQKKQGKGTKVASTKVVEDFTSLKSFTEKMREQGKKVTTKVVNVEEIGASGRISNHLNLDSERLVVYVQRVRLIDGEPIALFNSYLRKDIGINKNEEFSQSIYKLLENKYNIKIKKGKKVIEVARVTEEEADLLDIENSEPVLVIKNTTYDNRNVPIEYAEGIYRSDKYKYELILNRE